MHKVPLQENHEGVCVLWVILSTYCVGLETRTPNLYYELLRPAPVIATPHWSKQKIASPKIGEVLRSFGTMPEWGIFASFSSKIACFCGLDRTRTCDLADVNGAF